MATGVLMGITGVFREKGTGLSQQTRATVRLPEWVCSKGGAPGISQQPCFQLLWPACISNSVSPNPDWVQLGNVPCCIISTHTRLLTAKTVILITQVMVQISLCPSLDVHPQH